MREVNKLHDASQNQLMLYIQKLLLPQQYTVADLQASYVSHEPDFSDTEISGSLPIESPLKRHCRALLSRRKIFAGRREESVVLLHQQNMMAKSEKENE